MIIKARDIAVEHIGAAVALTLVNRPAFVLAGFNTILFSDGHGPLSRVDLLARAGRCYSVHADDLVAVEDR